MNWFVEHPEVTRYILEHERKVEPIGIPYEDEPLHTDEYPFCLDHRCPCHTDGDLESVNRRSVLVWIPKEQGLLTDEEAGGLFFGHNI